MYLGIGGGQIEIWGVVEKDFFNVIDCTQNGQFCMRFQVHPESFRGRFQEVQVVEIK
jgi:hypothetical protein